jgi:catechol-2,3-dioxygenase
MPTLRHTGILVGNLERAVRTYKELGFRTMGRVEILKAQKMRDEYGQVLELIQGNYHPHIAVNWVTDQDGNWMELVEERK